MRFFDRFKKGQPTPDDDGDENLTQHEIALDSMRALKPGLYEAVIGMSKNDCPETRLDFHRTILKGTLWYPIVGESTEGTQNLSVIPLPDGSGYAWPVYTEPESMKLDGYELQGHFLVSRADIVFQIAEQNGFSEVHINRGGPAGGAVMATEIPFLARGRSPYGDVREEDPTSTEGRTPTKPLPPKIMAAAKSFAEREGVRAVYFIDLIIDSKEVYPTVYFDLVDEPGKAALLTPKIFGEVRENVMGTPYVVAPLTEAELLSDFARVGIQIYPDA